jgi:hypothetical protein
MSGPTGMDLGDSRRASDMASSTGPAIPSLNNPTTCGLMPSGPSSWAVPAVPVSAMAMMTKIAPGATTERVRGEVIRVITEP